MGPEKQISYVLLLRFLVLGGINWSPYPVHTSLVPLDHFVLSEARLLPEFIARVGQLGGNLAKVDRAWTHFRLVSSLVPCGPNGVCTQTREVATLHVTGRALRVPEVAR